MTIDQKIELLKSHIQTAKTTPVTFSDWTRDVSDTLTTIFGNHCKEVDFVEKTHETYVNEHLENPDVEVYAISEYFRMIYTLLEKTIDKLESEKNTPTHSTNSTKPKPNEKEVVLNEDSASTSKKETRNSYVIGIGIFWAVGLPVIGGAFYLGFSMGNVKYDKDKIELTDTNKLLQDSIIQLNMHLKQVQDSVNKGRFIITPNTFYAQPETHSIDPPNKNDTTP